MMAFRRGQRPDTLSGMKIRNLLLILLAALAIAACGNKGPLVLPDKTDAEDVQEDDAPDDAGDVDAAGEPQGDGAR